MRLPHHMHEWVPDANPTSPGPEDVVRDRQRILVQERLVPLLRVRGRMTCTAAARELGVPCRSLAGAVERFPRTVAADRELQRMASPAPGWSARLVLTLHPDLQDRDGLGSDADTARMLVALDAPAAERILPRLAHVAGLPITRALAALRALAAAGAVVVTAATSSSPALYRRALVAA